MTNHWRDIKNTDLILINDSSRSQALGATAWIDLFPPERIVHIRRGSSPDLARVARLILRRAIGLVFSGGGARGFAHAGVMRALTEAGIPVQTESAGDIESAPN